MGNDKQTPLCIASSAFSSSVVDEQHAQDPTEYFHRVMGGNFTFVWNFNKKLDKGPLLIICQT